MLDTLITKANRRLKDLAQSDSGVSAVEFSLLTPFLVVGGLSTFDAGMAIYDKMMMTQVLRAGAHSAISADTTGEMLAMLEAAATDNFSVAQGQAQPGELALAVTTYCICPADTTTQVGCTSTCADGTTATEFYTLTASMEFDGVMLPNFVLDGSIDVMSQ